MSHFRSRWRPQALSCALGLVGAALAAGTEPDLDAPWELVEMADPTLPSTSTQLHGCLLRLQDLWLELQEARHPQAWLLDHEDSAMAPSLDQVQRLPPFRPEVLAWLDRDERLRELAQAAPGPGHGADDARLVAVLGQARTAIRELEALLLALPQPLAAPGLAEHHQQGCRERVLEGIACLTAPSR